MTDASRQDSLRRLESEVGVLIRRIRRVIANRARALHPDLPPSSYLMLAHLADHGPKRASALVDLFEIDKGAVSRQVQHLLELGLLDRVPDPDDGRAHLVSASAEAVRRMADVAATRRAWLDERLGDWSDDQLAGFVDELGRYNSALSGS